MGSIMWYSGAGLDGNIIQSWHEDGSIKLTLEDPRETSVIVITTPGHYDGRVSIDTAHSFWGEFYRDFVEVMRSKGLLGNFINRRSDGIPAYKLTLPAVQRSTAFGFELRVALGPDGKPLVSFGETRALPNLPKFSSLRSAIEFVEVQFPSYGYIAIGNYLPANHELYKPVQLWAIRGYPLKSGIRIFRRNTG